MGNYGKAERWDGPMPPASRGGKWGFIRDEMIAVLKEPGDIVKITLSNELDKGDVRAAQLATHNFFDRHVKPFINGGEASLSTIIRKEAEGPTIYAEVT